MHDTAPLPLTLYKIDYFSLKSGVSINIEYRAGLTNDTKPICCFKK